MAEWARGACLFRTWYRTDAKVDEPEYMGSFTEHIPASAFRDGQQIVDVDWSVRGWVQVTFLGPGGSIPGDVPWPKGVSADG